MSEAIGIWDKDILELEVPILDDSGSHFVLHCCHFESLRFFWDYETLDLVLVREILGPDKDVIGNRRISDPPFGPVNKVATLDFGCSTREISFNKFAL